MPSTHDTGRAFDRLLDRMPGQHAGLVATVRRKMMPSGDWSNLSGADVMRAARAHCERTSQIPKGLNRRLESGHLLVYLQHLERQGWEMVTT